MNDKFFVSFNSPQCGWMSVGFEGAGAEFHTTTAHTPHSTALQEILIGLSSMLESQTPKDEFVIYWSRNPEAYDFHFKRDGRNLTLEIFEFPSFERAATEREKMFEFTGGVREVCEAFYATFAHLEKEIHVDEFEFNWRQPFPQREFEKFGNTLKKCGGQ